MPFSECLRFALRRRPPPSSSLLRFSLFLVPLWVVLRLRLGRHVLRRRHAGDATRDAASRHTTTNYYQLRLVPRFIICSTKRGPVARAGGLPFPPMRAWLEQPHRRRHKAPPQPCALTTKPATQPGGSPHKRLKWNVFVFAWFRTIVNKFHLYLRDWRLT